jgi:hypothetical protein
MKHSREKKKLNLERRNQSTVKLIKEAQNLKAELGYYYTTKTRQH